MKKTIYIALAIGATVSLLSSCIKSNPDSPGFEFMPDMYRSPGPETNGIYMSAATQDSLSNRIPVKGSIPRNFTVFPYENTPLGDSLATRFWKSPLPHGDNIEEQGKLLYERYCIVCHGKAGDGNGTIVENGKYPNQPPNYQTKYKEGLLTDGHVYHVVSYGKGVMGSHASQLSPEERWQVIQYVQRLGRGGKSWTDWQKQLAEESTKPKTDTAAAADKK
jgi:mono/diheme cytochrome c family protein